MKRMLRHVLVALLAAIPLAVKPDVMLWGCGSAATVDGIGIQTYLQAFAVDDDNWNAVRVKMVKDGAMSYLGVWDTDNQIEWEGDWGVELGDSGSGNWGAEWIQSSVPDKGTDVADVLFQMELGHNAWDSGADDYVWTTLASTDPTAYSDLVDKYMYERYSIDPMTSTPWMPTEFHTIPEPCAGMLILAGIPLLVLKRKAK